MVKKLLSFMLVMLLVSSSVPMLSFASTAHDLPKDLSYMNAAATRSGSANDGKIWGLQGSGATAIVAQSNTSPTEGGNWNAYFQVDFGEYKELVSDSRIKLSFNIKTGTGYSDSKGGKFYIYALEDKVDKYSDKTVDGGIYSDGITANQAQSLGLHEVTPEQLVLTGDGTGANPTLSIDVSEVGKQAIANALQSGSDGIVTFTIKAEATSTYFRMSHTDSYLSLSYMSDDEYSVIEARDELSWSDISCEKMTAVTTDINLPDSYQGIPVIWSSSDDSIITSSGEVNRNAAADKELSLTASLEKYGIVAKKEFNVIVKAPIMKLNYSIFTHVRSNNANSSFTGGQIANKSSDIRMIFIKFDIRGLKSIISAADKIVMNLKNNQYGCGANVTVDLLPYDVYDWNATITYNQAGMDDRKLTDTTYGKRVWTFGEDSAQKGASFSTGDISGQIKELLSQHPSTDEISFRIFTDRADAESYMMDPTGFNMDICYTASDKQDISSAEDNALQAVVGSAMTVTKNAKLIYSFYNGDEFTGLDIKNITALTEGKQENIPAAIVPAGVSYDRVKLMILDGMNTLIPLCVSAEKAVNK